MKHIFAFERKEDYEKHEGTIQRFSQKLKDYQQVLRSDYQLRDLPKAVVWTAGELATTVFSRIPIPAYTNKNIIYMSPDLEEWRSILVKQLNGRDLPDIQSFYESFSENQMFVILAHELTHHSDLFPDEFDDEREDSIWFEEGMCFYLPRKLTLSANEMNEITAAEMQLAEAFKAQYGNHPLDDFGSGSYHGDLTGIMYDYWRSYLTVKEIVEDCFDEDIHAVFKAYDTWHKEGRKMPLTQFFIGKSR